MKLDTLIRKVGSVYHVEVGVAETNPFTPVELDALVKLGEPEVDCGGVIAQGELSFTLPSADRRFPSQFPVKATFSDEDFADAQERSAAFRFTIETRLTAARDALIAGDVSGTGEWLTTV